MGEQRFVGRAQELEKLHHHLASVLAGKGCVCFVTGQAGSGKTALVNRFFTEALERAPEVVVAVGSCNSQTGMGDPYLPFREALAMLTGDTAASRAAGNISPENANRLRTIMVRSIQVLVDVAPELVNVFIPGAKLLTLVGQAMVKKVGWMERLDQLAKRGAVKGVEPANDQGRIFEQFAGFLQRLSAEMPIILFLDDLQWADNASLNLLFYLARQLEAHPILIVGAYRPNDVALGRDGKRHPLEPIVHELTRYCGDIVIDLDDLPATVNRQFVDALIDAEPNELDEEFRKALFHQTGGHALFTVELIRAMQSRGDLIRNAQGKWAARAELDWHALPARIEGVIAERIARLDQEPREVLTVGSIEGESFAAEVVARVEAMPEREAIQLLSNELERRHGLLDAQGLVRLGAIRLSFYRFTHNLFQQYIYNNLSEAERHYLHRDVGAVIEALFAGQTEDVAAKLARHFEISGLPEKAVIYHLQAANKARRMSANAEASIHLRKGLELLEEISDSPARRELELQYQTALGTSMLATHGYASQEVQRAYARARELSRMHSDPRQTVPVLFGLSVYYLVSGALDQALEESYQLLALTEQIGEPGYLLGAHLVLGAAKMYLGRLEEARAHLEKASRPDESHEQLELACSQGQDPKVAALSFLSLVLWLQGYPEQALVAKDASAARAQKLGHAHSTAYGSSIATTLYQMLRLEEECDCQAEMTLAVSKGRFPLWQAVGEMAQGWVMAYRGDVEAGIAHIEPGLALWEGTGANTTAPYFRSRLVEAHLLGGNREAGLALLDDVFCFPEQAWWLPEAYRLRAELLLLAPGSEVEAANCLREGLQLARHMQAKSLELRLCMSLARLLYKQGKTAEGRAMLAECYGWFSEGFDTPDLRDARALLAELGHDGENLASSKSGWEGVDTSPSSVLVSPVVLPLPLERAAAGMFVS